MIGFLIHGGMMIDCRFSIIDKESPKGSSWKQNTLKNNI